MGHRGPPPKPTRILRLTGSREVEKRHRDEPEPDVAAPVAPKWLSAEGRAEWKRVVPELLALRILARVDRAALAAYCDAWAEYVAARKAVGKAKAGTLHRARAVKERNEARTAILRFAQEFGLTPSARTRISVEPAGTGVGDRDPLGSFAARKRAGGAA